MMVDWARASFPLFSLILLSSFEGTMFSISVTTSYRYGGSCLMVAMMSRSGVCSPSKSGCSKVATISLRLR